MTIPGAAKSGCEAKQEEAQARMDMIVLIVQGLMQDNDHIMPLFSLMKKREAAKNTTVHAADDELFSERPYNLLQLDVSWAATVVEQLSDMSGDEIARTLEFDTEAVHALLACETQIPLSMQLPPAFQVKTVCRRILGEMSATHGGLLKDWKARGGLLPTGAVDWGKGCYEVKFVKNRQVPTPK